MRPAIPTTAASTLLGTALGASVLALSTKALVVVIAGMVGAALAASSVATYYALVVTIPVQVELIGGVTVTKLLIPFCLAVVSFNALIGRGPWPTFACGPAGYLAGGFFISLPVSLMFEGRLVESFSELTIVAVYSSLFFLTLTFNRTPDQFRRLLWVIAIAGTVEAIITAAQVHYGFVMPGAWRSNLGEPTGEMVDGAISAIQDGKIRAEGTTDHPILLASYYLLTIPCTACLLLTEERPRKRFLLAGMVALMSYGWYYTFTRSSIIGFAVMAMVAAWFYSKAARMAIFVGIGLAFTGLLSYQTITESLSAGIQTFEKGSWFTNADINSASGSWQFRIESIVGGWNLLWAHPWLGVGFSQSIFHYTKYLPSWANHTFHPAAIHNVFLQVGSELGVVSLATFIGLWVWAFVCAKRGLHLPALRPYAVLMSAILLGQMAFLMITPMVREIWLTIPMAVALGYMNRTTEA
jgi:O-Antigen ligase